MTRSKVSWQQLTGCRSAEELAAQVRDIIAQEPFVPGDRLPTVRELAELSGLRRGEAYHTLVILAAEGWVVQKRGSGTFVGPRKQDSGRAGNGQANGTATRRIGVIPPGWDPRASHETVGAILHGIGMRAGNRGYRVEMVSASGAEYMTSAFADRVLSLQLDGAIWIQPAYELPLALVRLAEARLPLVVSGRGFPGLEVPSVVMDYAWLGELIANSMTRYGRTRLVGLVGCRDDTFTAGQVEGIRAALHKRGLELPDDHLLTVRPGHADRFYSIDLPTCARDFFARCGDFDAVYSMYPDMLAGLFELHQSGRHRCPHDYIHIHFARASMPLQLGWQDMPISFVEPVNEAVGRQTIRVLERLWGIPPDDADEFSQPILVEDPRLESLLPKKASGKRPGIKATESG